MRAGELAHFARDIKLEHSLFALPFAFIGALTASRAGAGAIYAPLAAKVLLAMVFARTAAMGFNRYLDAEIDAANPRTAGRAIPSGRLSEGTSIIAIASSAILFMIAAFSINSLAGRLAPAALAIVLGYSATKRFTSWSHLILGLALSLAPAGGWVAVAGTFDSSILPLMLGVLFWVAGFDVLYSLQDADFDRSHGLFSIPARFGDTVSYGLSRVFHATAVVCLIHFGEIFHLGNPWRICSAVTAAILVTEHVLARDKKKIPVVFFNLNAAVGFVLLAGFVGAIPVIRA